MSRVSVLTRLEQWRMLPSSRYPCDLNGKPLALPGLICCATMDSPIHCVVLHDECTQDYPAMTSFTLDRELQQAFCSG